MYKIQYVDNRVIIKRANKRRTSYTISDEILKKVDDYIEHYGLPRRSTLIRRFLAGLVMILDTIPADREITAIGITVTYKAFNGRTKKRGIKIFAR